MAKDLNSEMLHIGDMVQIQHSKLPFGWPFTGHFGVVRKIIKDSIDVELTSVTTSGNYHVSYYSHDLVLHKRNMANKPKDTVTLELTKDQAELLENILFQTETEIRALKVETHEIRMMITKLRPLIEALEKALQPKRGKDKVE